MLYVDSTLVNGQIGTTSDYRVKQLVKPLQNGALAKVNKLKPCTFQYRDYSIFKADGVNQTGFIAHEVQDAIGCGATGKKDEVDASGAPVLQSLDPIAIMSVLTKAVQELSGLVVDLQTQLVDLRGRIKTK